MLGLGLQKAVKLGLDLRPPVNLRITDLRVVYGRFTADLLCNGKMAVNLVGLDLWVTPPL